MLKFSWNILEGKEEDSWKELAVDMVDLSTSTHDGKTKFKMFYWDINCVFYHLSTTDKHPSSPLFPISCYIDKRKNTRSSSFYIEQKSGYDNCLHILFLV